jgi:rhamnose utilization protein RhaD (predicted bifunctional aldolase and dehydrogenase)/NAD(P)-dependent dehydrogenase (short-subunit alcohol dehydrogenase family)
MQNLWNDVEASKLGDDALALRVYTSRLLGKEPALVMHGGGNTSVKAEWTNLFGELEELLYVKGSGWDLATIEAPGFSGVKLDVLLRMAQLETLADSDMVRAQRAAMPNPDAPTPSVEAILHAIIPYKFVDHTHADVVVTITNTPGGEATLRSIYGDRLLYIPYVMPGFVLAREIYNLTQQVDWSRYEGMVLLHHGLFTFGDDAKTAYSRMIKLVSEAEDFLRSRDAFDAPSPQAVGQAAGNEDLLALATLRQSVSRLFGGALIAKLDASHEARGFSQSTDLAAIAQRGPITPDHVIQTKRVPLLFDGDVERSTNAFKRDYLAYFERHTDGTLSCLDVAPRWAVWPGHGTVAFGASAKKADVVADINRHTVRAIQRAERLGGWQALPEADIFAVEYWELEQAKLRLGGPSLAPLQGKVAIITGAASGIGKACAERLRAQGAAVVALDLNPQVTEFFMGADALGIVCDVTDSAALDAAVAATVRKFGGLDIVITNAGSFPETRKIAEIDNVLWAKSMDVNLTSHVYLLRACVPYLTLGLDPAIVVIASKNVPAPGPGQAAYSAAKAGLTQLARVAAMELGPLGIRVNVLHPNAVFDTGIWTDDVLADRAKHYGMTVAQYKSNNILHVEVTSQDIAEMACAMAGKLFAKTTGAQLPIDGGNDRVI